MKRIHFIFLILTTILLGFGSCTTANLSSQPIQTFNRADTAIVINGGIELTLTFNETTLEFQGTMENLNATSTPNVRVEVHIADASGNPLFEFGPTIPILMQAGEIVPLIMPTTAALSSDVSSFVTFTMHPESGASAGNGG